MKHLFRILPLFILLPWLQLNAQTSEAGTKTGLALNVAINSGVTLSDARFALGADVQLEHPLSNHLAITLTSGFVHFFGTSADTFYSSNPTGFETCRNFKPEHNLIPVKAGLKVNLTSKFYLAGAAGMGIDINGNSSLLWSAAAGYKISDRFDAGVKYENYTDYHNTNQLALRIGYRLF